MERSVQHDTKWPQNGFRTVGPSACDGLPTASFWYNSHTMAVVLGWTEVNWSNTSMIAQSWLQRVVPLVGLLLPIYIQLRKHF